MFQRITDKNILRVLVGGFGLVIVLLILASFIGIRSVKAIQGSAAQLENEQLASSRLIDEIHREQGTLNAVFYNLGKVQPDSVDRDKVLTQLNDTDVAIQRITAAGTGTPEETDWRHLQEATEAFSNEARRLLAQEDAESLFSLDLLRQQEQVIQIIRKLISAGRSRAEAAQGQIKSRSEELIRQSFVLIGACVLLALAFAIQTVRITASLFRQMEAQTNELSSVTWHMLENQETTARRFSHELHDELGQCLTAVKANLMSLASAPANAEGRLKDCTELVNDAISNVRELSQLLRPTILDDFGLDASIRWLTDGFMERTGIQVDYESNFSERLPDETETHLFRIAQEALTNIARHSGASRVAISLQADDTTLHLSIGDNGKGMPSIPAAGRKGMGMTGMRARARTAGGELTVSRFGESGVLLDVFVPKLVIQNESKDPHLVGR